MNDGSDPTEGAYWGSDQTHPTAAAGSTSGGAATDPFLGAEVLGQYRITAKIGEGGMGAIYRAHQPAIGRDVVIKVIHPWLSHNEAVVARFQAEARAVAQLQSPNIVSVFNFGQLPDGTLFLAMEYLPGQTLAEVLRQQGRFALRRVLNILDQCAAALDEAHRKAVVHRDFKPSNVMLVPQAGGLELVKVLDFGIAKIGESGGLTREGAMLGTPQYMAPEQLQGSDVDGRADVYSLGLVVYELLAGRPAFSSSNPIGYVHLHLNTEAPLLSQIVPEAGIPPAVDQCIRRALAKDPATRTPSAVAFAVEMRSVLSNPVPLSSPSSRAPALLAVGVAVAMLTGAGVAGFFLLAREKPREEPQTVVATEVDAGPAPGHDASDEPRAKPTKAAEVAPPTDERELNLEGLSPEHRALYEKTIPELEEELRSTAERLYGKQGAAAMLKQITPVVVTPKGVERTPYQKRALVQTILALGGTAEMAQGAFDVPDETVEELEKRYLKMECGDTVEARRLLLSALSVGMPKGEAYVHSHKMNIANLIKACKTP